MDEELKKVLEKVSKVTRTKYELEETKNITNLVIEVLDDLLSNYEYLKEEFNNYKKNIEEKYKLKEDVYEYGE